MSERRLKVDRRTKQYAVGALGFEVASVAIGLVNNLTRLFNETLIDLSQLSAGLGLALVGAAAESIRRLNKRARS